MKVTVYKLDENGREVWNYPALVLVRGETWIRLEAFFDRPRVDLGPVIFEEGDRFIETFYSDRWYNVFAVYEGEDGPLKGWYCNVCRPAEISEEAVRYEDLALDVWVSVEREITVLDEEEFGRLPLSAEVRAESISALSELVALAETGRLPT